MIKPLAGAVLHQGTIASPMAAYCTMKETARRVLFLRHFFKS